MSNSLKVRAILILAVIGGALFAALPIKDKINLGLDLRGGMHLVLQVETDDALRAETEAEAEQLQQQLQEKGITAQWTQTGVTTFELTGVTADQDDAVRDVVDDYLFGWDQRRVGGTLRFAMETSRINDLRDRAVSQSVETIRNRVDAFGVAEPAIQRSGQRIVVQLPGVDDPERVKSVLGRTAFLEFRLVAAGAGPASSRVELIESFGGRLPDDLEIVEQRAEDSSSGAPLFWAVEKKRVVTGRDLRNAFPSSDNIGRPVVSFRFSREGGRVFGDVTGSNVGRSLAILLDNKLKTAPRINSRITDSGIIEGNFTLEEVQDLSLVLRSGALPAGLTYLEDRTVGPTLGAESVRSGMRAGMIGASLVILAMFIVYRLTGFNAVLALVLNIVLVFGALAALNATLTLPGIAGIVLTIGMVVDANVLIFERIREELRGGRTVKSAVDAGFGNALSSILDANFTTLIAAVFLFMFGTGPIRGFAVTLSVGILASLFTSLFVSRWLFDLLLSRKQRVESLSI